MRLLIGEIAPKTGIGSLCDAWDIIQVSSLADNAQGRCIAGRLERCIHIWECLGKRALLAEGGSSGGLKPSVKHGAGASVCAQSAVNLACMSLPRNKSTEEPNRTGNPFHGKVISGFCFFRLEAGALKERMNELTKAGGSPACDRFCQALPVLVRGLFVLTAVFGMQGKAV